MKKYRYFITVILAAVLTLSQNVSGQDGTGLWVSAGIEKKIVKGTDLDVEAEYRLTDNFRDFDRWSAGLSLSTRLFRTRDKSFNVKAAAGYKFIRVLNPESIKYKGDSLDIEDGLDLQYYLDGGHDFNHTYSYYEDRHRFTASLQASCEVSRFKFSLRESYQFTCSDSVQADRRVYRFGGVVEKYDPEAEDFVQVKEPDTDNMVTVWKGGAAKQVLRSRIGVEYNIPHWKFDPFVSVEYFNRIDKEWTLAKTRLTAGIEFNIAKAHYFQAAYIRQDRNDDDEPAGSVVSISYKYSF
ncbi:MAG: DUF2490 domain-containing protein [Bacteroidaceae bacterium]|nr:DUF2490 domain-containing protein [Bacteroidaceae bacterium]